MISRRNGFNLVAGSLVAFLAVLYQSLFRVIPVNGDVLLGLPLGRETASPGLYSPYDLLVSSGIRGPFHLYKYLGGYLYQVGANVDLIWEGLFILSLFLTFLALWYLAVEITSDVSTASITVSLLAVAHPLRGSLHASAVPLSSFVTAGAAMPLAIVALILLMRKRYLHAMVVAGVIFNIHPYVGLLSASAIGFSILVDREERLLRRVLVVGAGIVCALPNIIYVIAHLPSNFVPVAFDFYGQFQQYAMHAFVEDHWREGYGWFFINLGGAAWLFPYIAPHKRKRLSMLMAAWGALMLLYVFNAYVVKNTSVLLMFLFRATYFVKPLIFVIVLHGLRMRWKEQRLRIVDDEWEARRYVLGIALLFFSSILPMKFAVLADVLALSAYALFLWGMQPKTSLAVGMTVLAFMTWVGVSVGVMMPNHRDMVESILVGAVCVSGVVMFILFVRQQRETMLIPADATGAPTLVTLVAIAFIILGSHRLIISAKDREWPLHIDGKGILNRIRMHDPTGRAAPLMRWVSSNTPRRALFAIPPDAWEEFGAFRIVAQRGLYITIMEVNQLSFDASVYQEAHERLVRLGTTFPARRMFNTDGYYALSRTALDSLADQEHVDYFIVERSQLRGSMASLPLVYTDERYGVVDLHAMSPGYR